MRTCVLLGLSAMIVVGAGAEHAAAQGKGHGLSKAMAAASKGSSSSSLNRASRSFAKSGSSYGKSQAGLNRAARSSSNLGMGASRRSAADLSQFPEGSTAVDSALEPGRADLNQQQILDHRLGQAQKLRQLSEQNGNSRLLDTAERMDANAIRNYERQTGQTYQPLDIALPPSEGTEPIDPAPQTNSEVTLDAAASSPELSQPAALPTSTKTAPQTRTSWLPAWLRWTR